MTTLNRITAVQGRIRNRPAARSGRDQRSRTADRVARCPSLPGSASSSGCQGAPATMSVGAAKLSSRCWIMCAKKYMSDQ